MLYFTFFPVAQLDPQLLFSFGFFWRRVRGKRRGIWPGNGAGLGFRYRLGYGFTIPFRVKKMMICAYKIVDCEKLLAVEKPRPAPDDLFELYRGVHRTHQHNISDISGIDASGQFL